MIVRVTRFFAVFILLVSALPSFAAHAIAYANSNGSGIVYYWVISRPSLKKAEKDVMKMCSENAKKQKHTSKCRFVGAYLGPKYLAFFDTNDGTGFGVASNENRQRAIDKAYSLCLEQGECPDTAATVVFDTGEPESRPANTVASGDCRPRTQQISCRSNCVNGNCVVEYENGCKIRVQVSPRLDPFSNQWTYPSPSC